MNFRNANIAITAANHVTYKNKMNKRILVLDQDTLSDLKKFAELNFVTHSEMKKIMSGDATPVGDRSGYSCLLDFGYRVVFSVEELPLKDGTTKWFKHMSISHDSGETPIDEVNVISQHLGFPVKDHIIEFDKCQMWVEEGCNAINVLCEVK